MDDRVKNTVMNLLTSQNEIIESVAALSGNVANRLIQSSIKEWIESTAERAAKKIRLDNAAEFSFKKPGLKNQHKNCTAILTAIEDAIQSLNNDDVETAKTVLEQGKKDVLHRIKLLRIADRNGWVLRIRMTQLYQFT